MSLSSVSFSGLESGMNTSAIITAEMAIYKMPLTNLQSEQTSLNTQYSDLQAINSQMLTLQSAANALSNPIAYDQAYSATSSNTSIATGTITGGTNAGSITLAVEQLATGSTQISSGTVASTVDVVASGTLIVSSGGTPLGITSLGAGTGLSVGSHTIKVTQASSGATASGTTTLASTTITSGNNQINVTINGTPTTVIIPPGTYTPAQLATAISQASSGALKATVNSSAQLSIATTQQGSSASLQLTGGSALSALGLTAGSAVNGVDGVINVDGTSTTVSTISGTGTTQVTLSSGTGGTLSVSIAGGLSTGSVTAQNVSVGDGSLSSVVSAINSAHAGVTATSLQVGVNQYALEVTSQNTGVAASSSFDPLAFSGSSLGTLQTSTAAQDAIVSVGGTGGYQVTSATNTVKGLLPGLSVNLAQVSATPVTLSVSPDGSQMVTQVTALVNAANQVLSSITADTTLNKSANTIGALNSSSSTLNLLAQQVLSIVGGAVGTSAVGSDGTVGESAGLAITKTGSITFNSTAFVAAYDANPSGVQSMFTEGGSFSPSSSTYNGQLSVAGATDSTKPGVYNVSISQSAAQAIDVGSATFTAPTSTLASAETYTIASGTITATYAASAGESVSNVIAGLNGALASAGIASSASLSGVAGTLQVKLSSAGYGAGSTFNVTASGGDQLGLTTAGTTYAGTDVVGTIDGQAATGVGQILSLTSPGDAADGLNLVITTPGITTSTSLGTVNYKPGLAQGLANFAQLASVGPNAQIPTMIAGLNNTLNNVAGQIALQNQLVATQQATLTTEFTNMEKMMTKLKSTSSFLSSSSAAGSAASSSSSTPSPTSSASTTSGSSSTTPGG
ncbi:MAG TPA: flagellar filament capping protein FliD [Acidimicrobiales bacterium]|jgi:flagellar hook-associated protein 2|nr:flagellar filament capping protein FliD [Acidimicrobiales bacterium]